MKTYLVGYDLNRPRAENDYPDMIVALKQFGTWWHCLDSTWIIKTSLTSVQIRDRLVTLIDSSDELLVVELSGIGAWAGFDSTCSDWLTNNLPLR